jgi:hypothetical protein
MGQSPSSEANRYAARQEILRVLWNWNVYYFIHKCTSNVRLRSQLNPVHTHTSYYMKFHHNIISTSKPGSPKWSLSLMFHKQNLLYNSPEKHDNTADAKNAEVD